MNDTEGAAHPDACIHCGGGIPVGGGLTAGVTRDEHGRKRWVKACSEPCHRKRTAEVLGTRRCVQCGNPKSGEWLCSKPCRKAFDKRVSKATKELAKDAMPNGDDPDKRLETTLRMIDDAQFLRAYWRGEAGPKPEESPPQRARVELGKRVSRLHETRVSVKREVEKQRQEEARKRRAARDREATEAQREADRQWREELLKGTGDDG